MVEVSAVAWSAATEYQRWGLGEHVLEGGQQHCSNNKRRGVRGRVEKLHRNLRCTDLVSFTRGFSREFKVEAVKLVTERGVSVSQAASDLDIGETVLRRWMRELAVDPQQAFQGQGVLKPELAEIDRLRKAKHRGLGRLICCVGRSVSHEVAITRG